MAQFKTCEEFVLNELEQTKRDLVNATKELQVKSNSLTELKSLTKGLFDLIEIKDETLLSGSNAKSLYFNNSFVCFIHDYDKEYEPLLALYSMFKK